MTDLLGLLLGARDRWETVRMTTRGWQDVAGMRAALERHAERRQQALGQRVGIGIRGHGEPTSETETRTWIDRPARRSRTELDTGHGTVLDVRDGKRAWWYAPAVGAHSRDDAEPLDFPQLDPFEFAVASDLTTTGSAEVAGRPAITATAIPPTSSDWPGIVAGLTMGADEVLLAVDAERGVLLRLEARLDGRPFAITEVTEIAFDEAFDDDVFRFGPREC